MKTKRTTKLSIFTLIISALPLVTLLPVALHITMPDAVRTVWASINCVLILAALVLSLFQATNSERRNALSIVSLLVSIVLALNILACLGLALALTFLG